LNEERISGNTRFEKRTPRAAEWTELKTIVMNMTKTDRMFGFQLLAKIEDVKLFAEERFHALDQLDRLLEKYSRCITITDATKAMDMMLRDG
jgi:hypothetical protein